MDTTDIVYGICRSYVSDRRGTLPADVETKISGYIRSRSFDKLADCTSLLTPDLAGVEGYRTLLQIAAFFKKNAVFTNPQAARLQAFLNFERGERICAITNRRLDHYLTNTERMSVRLQQIVTKMKREIDLMLGPFPDFLEKLPELIKVTAGATATKGRRESQRHKKISLSLCATPGAAPYLKALSQYFGYGPVTPSYTSSNRLEFVPKSWKTDRTIACEPEGSMFLQLAVDTYLKRRLKLFRVNLRNQGPNQESARLSSINNDLSTVDLEMASDTLAYNTVAGLFPYDWFSYLRAVRSSYAQKGSYRQEYAKFSSMGNGATFVIETLVFTAICRAVGSSKYNVYGDDIIVEVDKVQELLMVLRFFGFQPNASKTFITGPFRESCGKHWYRGIDVTPQYIREVDRRKAICCHIINSMILIAKPYGALQERIARLVGELNLPFVPYMENSMGGVWISPHEAYRKKLIKTEAYIPKTKTYVMRSKEYCHRGIRAAFLWHLQAKVEHVDDRRWAAMIRGVIPRDFSSLTSDNESSRYAVPQHKYVRKWTNWKVPVAGTPVQLNSWTDTVTRQTWLAKT